jgi:hypothetical protein
MLPWYVGKRQPIPAIRSVEGHFVKAFHALLVEGTSGVGKSTLIDALLRRHVGRARPRKIRSLLHLAQTHTIGPLAKGEDAATLTIADNATHLDRIVSMLEWLHAGAQEHSCPLCFVIIDTLHLTHCVRPGVVRWADVVRFDRRLAALGCKLLFFQAAPPTIWERGIKPRVNEQFLLEYARKFGSTHQEIHEYFVSEQEILADLFERSVMPKLCMPNEGSVDDTLEQAYRFWTDDSNEAAWAASL